MRIASSRTFLLLTFALALAALPAHGQSERAQALHRSADEKYAKKNFDGAISDWTRAMREEPRESSWVFNRGLARVGNKDDEGAIADFSAAIGLKPDNARYYVERAFARYRRGIHSAAFDDLDRAIALEPQNAERLHSRASLRTNLGNLKDAMTDINAALKLDPRRSSAYTLRGVLRQAQGDLDGALADYRQTISLNEAANYTYFWRYLAQKQKRQDGFADLARAVAKWPEGWDRSIGLYLIDSLPEKDLLAKAAQGSADAKRDQLSEAHYYVGMTALLAGHTAKAQTHFEQCIEQGVRTFLEDVLARAELSRLRSP